MLVTGDREWCNAKIYGENEAFRQLNALFNVLFHLWEVAPDTIIVHGDARGADKIAGQIWLELTKNLNQVEAHPADWTKHHKAAGPIRNRAMITISAERASNDGHILRKAIACHSHFEDSKGTADMVKVLEKEIGRENIRFIT